MSSDLVNVVTILCTSPKTLSKQSTELRVVTMCCWKEETGSRKRTGVYSNCELTTMQYAASERAGG
jgi:hypothetical protein